VARRIAAIDGNITSIVAFDAGDPQRMNFTFRVQGVAKDALLQAVSEAPGLEVLHAWTC
jgi:hypothetical protein